MNHKTLKFNRTVEFLGRNGTFKCTGMVVTRLSRSITIEPITSKDQTGVCYIEIPEEEIDGFINQIKELQ